MGIVDEFVKALKPTDKERPKAYSAEVSKIDDEGVVWVYLAGSEAETPTALSSSEVKAGDSVNVEWRNNKLYIAGNTSNPSAGTTRVTAVEQASQIANDAAVRAVRDAGIAQESAEVAQEAAQSAQESATNASEYASRALGNLSTVQSVTETLNWITAHGTMTLTSDTALDPTHVYFVVDQSGDYEVGGTHYSVVTEPDVADISTYYELSIDESLNNYVGTHLAVTSEGLWLLPDAGGNKVLIATGSGTTYTTAGTYIIGKVNNVDTVLASFLANGATIGKVGGAHSVIDTDGQRFYASDGTTQLANIGYGEGQAQSGTDIAPYYTLGTRADNSTVGNYSIAEGNGTTASGYASHAEGWTSFATAPYAHAEGGGTSASGIVSHAEGGGSEASGMASHAQNYNTKASSDYQTALGKYNEEDANDTYAVIVGNGTSNSSRSNALTVDWDGNVKMALNTSASSGSTDYALYQAITALGWQNDVIE